MGMPALLMVAGTGISAYGQYQQGQALYDQAKTEQKILDYNASIKDKEADLALQRSRAQAQQFKEEGDQVLASQNVAIAKGGVLSSSGTPSLLMETTADTLDADRRSILAEGFINKSFLNSEAEGLRYQGRAALSRGKNLRTASYINVGTTLLTGFTKMYQMGAIGGGGKNGSQTSKDFANMGPGGAIAARSIAIYE